MNSDKYEAHPETYKDLWKFLTKNLMIIKILKAYDFMLRNRKIKDKM